MIPPKATAQQKGVFCGGGKPRFFEKANVKSGRQSIMAMLLPHKPAEPFTVPLSVSIYWTFPFRATEKAAVFKAGQNVPLATRPDLDNLEKGLLDAMTVMRFWVDDGLIWDKRTRKMRGTRPGITITVLEAPTCEF
jgi:Holliday junction resolvase RusA-like endonuclease